VPITLTVAFPNTADQFGTVPVQVSQLYTTITSLFDGTITSTLTAPPSFVNEVSTKLLLIPQEYVILTSLYRGSFTSTTTLATPTSADKIGTVVVQVLD
jgi:hypothetical protein